MSYIPGEEEEGFLSTPTFINYIFTISSKQMPHFLNFYLVDFCNAGKSGSTLYSEHHKLKLLFYF